MKHRTHGGDWAAFEAEYGRKPLDFSMSVSPLGVPEAARAAIAAGAGEQDRYPDPACRALRRALAAHWGVGESRILCGAGASDLLYRIAYAARKGNRGKKQVYKCARPPRALLPVPCFTEYEAALGAADWGVEYLFPDKDFHMTDAILQRLDGVDLLILCQPSNPTGLTVEKSLLRAVLERCAAVGTRVVADECFLDLLDEPERFTVLDMVDEFVNLSVLRAFTKQYALAGLRLGCLISADGDFLAAVERAGPPWAVSDLAQRAGLAALSDGDYLPRLRRLLRRERPRLRAGLAALGLRVLPGEANFLLFQSPVPLDAPLRERGVLLRGCGDFAGLDDSWYRAAVRTGAENDALLRALREALG